MKLNCVGLVPLIFATMAINAMPLMNVFLKDSQSITVVSDKPGGGPRDPLEISLKYS